MMIPTVAPAVPLPRREYDVSAETQDSRVRQLRQALESIPDSDWDAWFGEAASMPDGTIGSFRYSVVATFLLPLADTPSALCLLQVDAPPLGRRLLQTAVQLISGSHPLASGTTVLHQERDSSGDTVWSIRSAWDQPLCRQWLRDALRQGLTISSDEWQWIATPEHVDHARPGGGRASQLVGGRRHDVLLFEPDALAVVYRQLTRGAQPEIDALRHLERTPGQTVAPTLLASAVVRSPDGDRSAAVVLEDMIVGATTVHALLVSRLRRSFEGDHSLQAAALDDVRAVGVATRELHAALGRPFKRGIISGATTASASDVLSWAARVSRGVEALHDQLALDPLADALRTTVSALEGKLAQFAAAAQAQPGISQRIHGDLRLDCVLIAPPRTLTIVEFDGDMALDEQDRVAPQSPWRDVARLLISLGECAAQAAEAAGADVDAYAIAWLWEREARKSCLEGYGTGGGALHALLAIFEMDFAARLLHTSLVRSALIPPHAVRVTQEHSRSLDSVVAVHTLERLLRTMV